jgi:hypothetical protein
VAGGGRKGGQVVQAVLGKHGGLGALRIGEGGKEVVGQGGAGGRGEGWGRPVLGERVAAQGRSEKGRCEEGCQGRRVRRQGQEGGQVEGWGRDCVQHRGEGKVQGG